MMQAGWQIPNWGSADQWVKTEAAHQPPGIEDTLRQLRALAMALTSQTSRAAERRERPVWAHCAVRRRT